MFSCLRRSHAIQTRKFPRSNLSLTNVARKSPTYHALPPFIDKFWQALKKILLALLAKLPPNVQAWIKKVITFLEQEEQKIPGFIKLLVGALAANATGWNHAKFFSVNGITSVASGYNWWDGYATGPNVPNNYIFDTYVLQQLLLLINTNNDRTFYQRREVRWRYGRVHPSLYG